MTSICSVLLEHQFFLPSVTAQIQKRIGKGLNRQRACRRSFVVKQFLNYIKFGQQDTGERRQKKFLAICCWCHQGLSRAHIFENMYYITVSFKQNTPVCGGCSICSSKEVLEHEILVYSMRWLVLHPMFSGRCRRKSFLEAHLVLNAKYYDTNDLK